MVFDDTINLWYESYLRDFFPVSQEVDDWYIAYRRDFMPDRFGRIFVGVKSAVKEHVETLFKDLVLVGRGRVTNDKCGKFKGYYGCLQHNPVFVRPYFNYCDKPSCSQCYRFGWAAKEASSAEPRLLAASEKFGLPVEHVVVSLPKSDYDLTLKEAKLKCQEIFCSLGGTGGFMIPHGNRVEDVTHVEYFSPHFHILGFFRCSIEECRKCSHNPDVLNDWDDECKACDGIFSGLRREPSKSGYFVKVLSERISVAATVFYQCHHSSMDYGRVKARVATYFGSCGYNNLKVKYDKPKMVCPECGSGCGPIEHVGSRVLYVLPRRFWNDEYKKEFRQPFLEDGKPAWRVRESNPYGVDD